MRKLILQLAVSLDGFIDGPKGEYDWCFTDQDYGMSDFFKRIDAVFMGRKSYELTQAVKDELPPGFPQLKEYIFSNTLDIVKNGAVLLKGDIKTKVEEIKNSEGKNIWLFGGAGIISELMNLELVDELTLAVHPVIIGGGTPLFKNINQRTWLNLTDTKTYPSGLLMLTYTLKK
jgi:dihydrofolate reductase